MTTTALAMLGQNALAFAQCYVQLVDALTKEGVVETLARQEARAAATMMILDMLEMEEGDACPLCGRIQP